MSVGTSRFKGNVKIRGRPREQAHAEIMLLKQKEAYEERQRKRRFFTLLDILALLSLGFSIYLFYQGEDSRGIMTLIPGIVVFLYYLLRNLLRKNKHISKIKKK